MIIGVDNGLLFRVSLADAHGFTTRSASGCALVLARPGVARVSGRFGVGNDPS